MGRAYAGILGPIAFALLTARGLLAGAGVEATLLSASGGLFLMAAFGYVAGWLADYLVRDSVRTQFEAAMAEWEKRLQMETTQPKPVT